MSGSERLKTLRQMLWVALSRRITPHGFRGRRTHGDWEFERRYPFGPAFFSVYFIKHRDDFDVTANVFLRLDNVEEIANRRNKRLTDEQKKQTITLGGEVGSITIGEDIRWTIRDESDVEPVAAQLEQQFVEVALPYIGKYGGMAAAYEVLSSDDEAACIHCSNPDGVRAMAAVAAALILEKDGRGLRGLIERNRAILEDNDDFLLAEFDEFVESLVDDGLLNFEP